PGPSRPVPWWPRREPAPRERRLNLAPRWGLPPHPSLRDGVWGWVAETGLERPAYPQMPLRGNENVQTPEPQAEARGYENAEKEDPHVNVRLLAVIKGGGMGSYSYKKTGFSGKL